MPAAEPGRAGASPRAMIVVTSASTAKYSVARISCSPMCCTNPWILVFSARARTTTAAAPPAISSCPRPAAVPRPSTTSAAVSVVPSTRRVCSTAIT